MLLPAVQILNDPVLMSPFDGVGLYKVILSSNTRQCKTGRGGLLRGKGGGAPFHHVAMEPEGSHWPLFCWPIVSARLWMLAGHAYANSCTIADP